MSLQIAGIGTAVPPYSVDQREAAEVVKRYLCETPQQERLLSALYWYSGVERRHSVLLESADGNLEQRQSLFHPEAILSGRIPTTRERMARYEAEAGRLVTDAARAALQDADIPPQRVTHLVTVTCSGFYAPGFDTALMTNLGLSRRVERIQIGFMGCHAALNGLRVARSFVESNPKACVLLSAVELCSLHHYCGWDTEKMIANALFADGAAALIGLSERHQATDAWQVRGNGSTVIENSEEAMTWRIGDHGFEMTLSPRIPELINRHVRPFLQQWLAECGLTIAQIGSWAVHPGGPRILAAFAEAVGVRSSALEPSLRVLSRYGNMSSPTVLFILDELRRTNAARPCVALGFGPGLTVEAALLA